ncbi:Dirigent protein [Sesbania bispinosa]|nr:Dirigent protein [Sesbania bispinosa]
MLFGLCSAKRKQYEPCKHLGLYFHDILYNGKNAANATSAIVAAPEGANLTKLAGQSHFGNIAVFDDPITLDNNLHSKTRWEGTRGTITFAGADPILKKPEISLSLVALETSLCTEELPPL